MGRTNREIISLTTSEALNVDEIWEKWLPAYLPPEVYEALCDDKVARFRLELLFATVSRIPRAVQYVVTDVQKYFRISRGSDMRKIISPEMMNKLYLEIFKNLYRKYGCMTEATVLPKHMRAILFEEEIALDTYITDMVKNSLLTNSLKRIGPDVKLCPKTSIISMKIYSKDRNEKYWQSISHTITELLENMCSEGPNTEKLGQFLETSVRGLINARLYVLMKLAAEAELEGKGSVYVSISQLLLLDDIDSIKGANEKLVLSLSKEFQVPPRTYSLAEIDLTAADSYIDIDRFLSTANVAPEISGSVLELKPFADRECFEYGLLFSSGFDGEPFTLFIDVKSGIQYANEEIMADTGSSVDANTNQGGFDFSDLPKDGKQALHMRDISDRAKTWDPAKVAKGSLLEALRSDNYLYIYVNIRCQYSSNAARRG